MELISIYPPYIYSVKYDNSDDDELNRLFSLWDDMSYVVNFMETNSEYLKADTWKGLEPEDAARQVRDEADFLEDLFEELYDNCIKGKLPDYDTHFHFLEGKYKYEIEWIPVKTYGNNRPSLIRIYGIKLNDNNTYLITGGGIKLADTIQNSPGLKDHVLQDIDRVRDFLKANGIFDSEDMEV